MLIAGVAWLLNSPHPVRVVLLTGLSAVVELSTAQERRAAHRALAGVRPDEAQRLAWHLAEASIGPDERVAEMLEASARQMLGRGDPVGAVSALTRAAELSPAEPISSGL